MKPKIKIREASINDIPILVKNNQALAHETENIQLDSEIVLAGVSNALKRKDCHYFVAELNSEIAGQTMITYEWSDWRNGLFWWIQSVYVKKTYRRKGVFKKMYKFIHERAINDKKCTGIRLYVENNNSIAQKVYNNLGMEETYYKLFEVDFNE